jgi:astacin
LNLEIARGAFYLDVAATSAQAQKWLNAVVPYTVSPALPQPERVTGAIAAWTSQVGVRFVQRTTETDYIEFVPTQERCASKAGRVGGRQEIVLAPNCSSAAVMHEIGHAVIGMVHEQSRPDRDDYVTIVTANVRPDKLHNFEKREAIGLGGCTIPQDVALVAGTCTDKSYDYDSIMHYGSNSFSINGEPTILTKDPAAQARIGQKRNLSPVDIAYAKSYYALP